MKQMEWLTRILLAGCLLGSACYDPEYHDLQCAADDGCPAGYTCVVDICRRSDMLDAWWHPAWRYRRKLTLDNQRLPHPSGDLPILVRLPRTMLANSTWDGDLRFVSIRGARVLAYELDAQSQDNVLVWVRPPTIQPDAPEPALWLYYGNSAAPPTSSGPAVFGDEYVSVHHFTADLVDASGHGHTGSPGAHAQPPRDRADGRIGRAREFARSSTSCLQLADETGYDFTTEFTLSAWVSPNGIKEVSANVPTIAAKGNTSWRIRDWRGFIGFGTTQKGCSSEIIGRTSLGSTFERHDGSPSWHHVAVVFNDSEKRVYIDGRLNEFERITPTLDTNNASVTIGCDGVTASNHWDGSIDEVRISARARDDAWIKAEYLTVADPGFVTIGEEEALGAPRSVRDENAGATSY